MNHYRCETCKHRWGNDKCPIKLTDIYGGTNIYKELKYVIDSCGCASHSDFQSERDKVLDELERWIPESAATVIDGHIPIIWVDDLKEKLKELRQKAGE